MTDHTELKRLAKAAPEGPWYQHCGIKQVLNHDCETVCETFEEDGDCPTARFIAAANPTAVLALIAENERLERKNANQSESIREYQDLVMGGDVSLGMLKADIRVTTGERDELRAEIAGLRTGYEAYERVNAELKADVEALRNSSSCVDDLSALVRQLVHRLKKASPDNDLPEKALDYLKRKGLQGSPLRNERDDVTELEAQKIYDSWAGQDGFVPWVKGGNSIKQDDARRLARAAMGKGEQS